MSEETICAILKLFHSEIRSMINYIQLNQPIDGINKIIDDKILHGIHYFIHLPSTKKKYFNIFMILVVLVMLIYDRSFINIYPLLFKITPISQFIQKYKLKSTFSLESFQVVLHIDTTSQDRKSTRLNSSHALTSRMPSSA